MKANRKFIEDGEAVSAVIGVILMVAITVAIAATVYVYVSGMLTTGSTTTPDITFYFDDTANTLTVSKISESGIAWTDIHKTGTCTLPAGTIEAGDAVTGCVGTVTLNYQNTTLLGSWDFSNP